MSTILRRLACLGLVMGGLNSRFDEVEMSAAACLRFPTSSRRVCSTGGRLRHLVAVGNLQRVVPVRRRPVAGARLVEGTAGGELRLPASSRGPIAVSRVSTEIGLIGGYGRSSGAGIVHLSPGSGGRSYSSAIQQWQQPSTGRQSAVLGPAPVI